jgi:hypothetical protein
MSRSLLRVFALTSGLFISVAPAFAADYAVQPRQARYATPVLQIDRGPNPSCGPRCGCPIVVHARHRSLGQAYPYGFDPRTRDEPLYYYGPSRTYVRYANPRNPDLVLQY